MLFPDLSAPEATVEQARSEKKPAIASVADRFLALCLDFLIFSPIVSLFIASMMRQTKTYFLLDTQSTEGYIAVVFMFGFGIALTVFLQSAFLFFWQATPGQLFMHLRVGSYPTRRPYLTYPQCLMRSVFWMLSCLTFGIPFMEIVSHPLRRALHERVSDTLVVTLKKESDPGPLPLEEKFIATWMRVTFIFFLFFAAAFITREYQSLLSGRYKAVTTNENLYCSEMAAPELDGNRRLDAAISLFLLDSISSECLRKEAEASLWADPVNAQGWAYLAKYLVSDPTTQKEYLAKLCADGKSEECTVGRYLAGETRVLPTSAVSKTWLEQVLRVEELYIRHDYVGSLKQIEKLEKVTVLSESLEKKFVRAVWALNNQSGKSGRAPASSEKAHWLEVFKGRYQVE